MPKGKPIINSFNAGEVSPKIGLRTDIQKYFSSCRTLENFIPLVEGGVTRMPGTYFVIATKDSSKKSRMLPFQFSTIQSYQLEIGEYYIRFYKDQGQIPVAYAAWANSTAYALGVLVTSGGNYYRCIIAHTSNAAPGVFATDLALGYWAASAGATDLAYEIPTPYAEDDLLNLKITQSADIMWIFHPSYPAKQLTRTGHTAWTLTNHQAKIQDPFTITAASQAATCVITVTYTDTAWVTATAYVVGDIRVNGNYHYYCAEAHTSGANFATDLADGKWHRFDLPEEGNIIYISGVVGMTEINDLFFTCGTVTDGAGTATIQLSGINSTAYTVYTSDGIAQMCQYGTADNRPGCGTFYEQRLALGGSNDYPQRFDMSASGDYDDFNLGTDDDDAIQFTLVSDRVDRILWMLGQDYLMMGTVGGIWKVSASSSGDPLTATNITAKKQVTLGCKDIDPEVVTDSILWVTRGGISVRQLSYSFEVDKFISPDLTRIAKHITRGETRALSGIIDMDFQKEPLPILWCVRADGQLLGMTYETQEQIYAWFRIVTDGLFESVSVISDEDEEDEVWVIVNRTIGGSPARYVEFFKPTEFFGEIKDCFFVHSGLTWDGGDAEEIEGITNANPAVVTITGHPFINGDLVRIKDVEGMPEVNQGLTQAYTVANAAAATFELSGINTSLYAAWITGTAYVIGNRTLQGGISYQCLIAHTAGTFATDLAAGKWEVISGYGVYIPSGTAQKVKKVFTTGLDHLKGEIVDILIDGAVAPQETVTVAGTITADWYGNLIHVGLPVTATLEPAKLHVNTPYGDSGGKLKKVYKLTISFFETRGGKAGPDSDNLKIIPFGTGVQPTLYTGFKEFEFPGDWEKEAAIAIVQDQPLPMTVLAIIPEVEVGDR